MWNERCREETLSSLCVSLPHTFISVFIRAKPFSLQYSFLNATDKFSHPYQTTGRIIVLHVLEFMASHSCQQENHVEL